MTSVLILQLKANRRFYQKETSFLRSKIVETQQKGITNEI